MKTDEKQVRRALEHAEVRDAGVDRLRNACRAVLLFHSSGPWDETKARRWRDLTGQTDATTKSLCDAVREALVDVSEVA